MEKIKVNILAAIFIEREKENAEFDKNINHTILHIQKGEFISGLKELQENKMINGVVFAGTGDHIIPFLNTVTISNTGLKYLEKNIDLIEDNE